MTDAEAYNIVDEIQFVTNRVYPTYSRFVDREDITQELHLYVLDPDRGERLIAKWREKGETHRIYLALFATAKLYCEKEKAAKSGYAFEDVAWYSPDKIADLVALALDPEFDGITGESAEANPEGGHQSSGREGGTLLAMIADVRKALKAKPSAMATLMLAEEEDEDYRAALVELSDFLGGEFPDSPSAQRGRRKVMSNAAAIAATREVE